MLASNFGTCLLFQAQSATAHRSAARLVHSCCETSSPPTFLYYQSLATHTELQHYITFLLTKILVWVSQTDSYFNSRHYIIATCKSPHLSAAQLLPPCSWYDPSCSNCKTCETGLACNTWYHHILFWVGISSNPRLCDPENQNQNYILFTLKSGNCDHRNTTTLERPGLNN